MKIGILQADSVLAQFQEEHGNYPEMVGGVLGSAAAHLGVAATFETFDVEHGQYPDSIAACDGYVITGSRKSVYDDEPWIAPLMEFVRELHSSKTKLVGLCFGHQLVAEALGGKTKAASVGWCVGVHESELVKKSWFMDEEEVERYTLIVSHRDQVVTLPDEAQLLATSRQCPNSMYSIGDHILTMQGHPEFNRDYSRDLIEMRAEILGPDTYQRGVASLETPLLRDVIARWIIRFFNGKSASGPEPGRSPDTR